MTYGSEQSKRGGIYKIECVMQLQNYNTLITHTSTIELTLYNQIVDLTIFDQTYKIDDNAIELIVP